MTALPTDAIEIGLSTHAWPWDFGSAWKVHMESPDRSNCGEGTDGSDAATSSSHDAREVYFAATLDHYLSLKGVSQKRARTEIALELTLSPHPQKRIRCVLESIKQNPSEDRLQAAIDLLSLAGTCIEDVATKLALGGEAPNENVAFVVSAAAGRANNTLIANLLILARSEAIREAAVELAVTLPRTIARSLLRDRALNDSVSYIRERAAELLEEVG